MSGLERLVRILPYAATALCALREDARRDGGQLVTPEPQTWEEFPVPRNPARRTRRPDIPSSFRRISETSVIFRSGPLGYQLPQRMPAPTTRLLSRRLKKREDEKGSLMSGYGLGHRADWGAGRGRSRNTNRLQNAG